MHYNELIASAIRYALDAEGIELTWHDVRAAATEVERVLNSVFEDARRYRENGDA